MDQVENVGVRGETERAGLFYVESSVSSISGGGVGELIVEHEA